MRALLYVRVSKEDMRAETQLSGGKESIRAEGWECISEIVDDDGTTSKRREFQKRSGLAKMLNAAKDRAFDVLVVRDETRLGGDMARVSLVLSDLNDYGVKVWCFKSREFLQTDRAIDRFVVMARNLASELEREKAAERTHDAFIARAQQGLSTGGGLFGYRNVGADKQRRPEVDPEQLPLALDIARRFADGEGLRSLSRSLNEQGIPSPTGKLWCHSALYTWLKNPKIHGDGGTYNTTAQGIYKHGTQQPREDRPEEQHVEHPWPRLLPPDLSERVKGRMTQVKRSGRVGGRGSGVTYLLGSKTVARCGDCGGPIWASRNTRRGKERVKAYGCGHRHDGRSKCDNGLWQCHDEVDAAVRRYLLEQVLTESVVTEIAEAVRRRFDAHRGEAPAKVDALRQQARQLQAEVARATERLFDVGETIPKTFMRSIADREQRLDALNVEIAQLEAAPKAIGAELDKIETEARRRLRDLQNLFASDAPSARAALQSLLETPLTLTPEVHGDRRVYRVQGALALGRFLMSEPADATPTDSASSTFSSGGVPTGI